MYKNSHMYMTELFFLFTFPRHDELLQVNGIYSDMWHQQLTKKEDNADDKNKENGTLASGSDNHDADAT